MKKKQKYVLLSLLIVLCGTFVFSQYQEQKQQYERLATVGITVPIVARSYSSWGVTHSHYYFITKGGQKIEGDAKYPSVIATYDPADPTKYELSFNSHSYSPKRRIFFFFFLYLPGMIWVLYGGIQTIFLMWQSFKGHTRA